MLRFPLDIRHFVHHSTPMKIYILTFDIHNSGLSSSAHRTAEGANSALFDYVKSNWGTEMPDDFPLPADEDEAIAAYFSDSEDAANIEEVELVD